jgi:uracil DNA glycosylase
MEKLFDDPNMKTILDVLDEEEYSPGKNLMFKPFSLPVDKIDVVIMGDNPYRNFKFNNGLAFASAIHDKAIKFPEELDTIITDFALNYKSDLVYDEYELFDSSLELWHEQGILLLNYSLSIGLNRYHTSYWKFFTEAIIKFIDNRDNIGFIFIGDCSYLSEKIKNPKNGYLKFPPIIVKGESNPNYWQLNLFQSIDEWQETKKKKKFKYDKEG